jgi:hypothetical protein
MRQSAFNYDREYQFKISGTYIFPYGIMTTAYFSYEQGRPFNPEIPIWLDQGRVWISAEERGSQRFPSSTFLDLRLEKEFKGVIKPEDSNPLFGITPSSFSDT